jgi:uncharacterized protein DUF6152
VVTSISSRARLAALSIGVAMLAVATTTAHHSILAKFDDTKSATLKGLVTLVDWTNPHVHVFMNVRDAKGQILNWAVELESPIDLKQSGWSPETLHPGDGITVQGISARNGSRQVWARSVVVTATGREVFKVTRTAPAAPLSPRPVPKFADGTVRLGATPGASGYWAYPSSTALVEDGVTVAMDPYGQLKNIADASKVAPMQPWALALYQNRQRRFLQDDPTYINCKPPGGPRQFQQPFGVQFVEDKERQRIFELIGGGNHNYRILYMDGRGQKGQVGGDDDNPLYYGRAVAKWEGATLAVSTAGFNEDFWFTNGGLPHTDQLQLTERFTRTDFDTLKYEVTVSDPAAYTRDWKATWTLRWVGGEELPVYFCQDNRP